MELVSWWKRRRKSASSGKTNSRSKTYLSLEMLEGREVPATFGFPWASPTHLTISFAPDGTSIAGLSSDLNTKLSGNLPTATWQQDILKAFQTWAVQANIDIAVVADSGLPFGTTGPVQGDSRFGDIRIGGLAMTPSTLAVSIPSEPFIAGTWAGDVIVNTAAKFGRGGFDLFTTMLHEAGHVFGLAPSPNFGSVMFNKLNMVRTRLPFVDIANLQKLYGHRASDLNEGRGGNGTLKRATRLDTSSGDYKGETPVVAYGDITTTADIDNFWIQPINDYTGPMTFRLQTTGLSMLAPRLTILDSSGKVLGQAISTSFAGDTIEVHLDLVNPDSKYFVRVEGATKGVFGIGRYGLAVTFDHVSETPESRIDQVLRGPYESLSPSELQAIFQDEGHDINDDNSSDDQVHGANRLKSDPGYAANSHFDVIASLSSATDRDIYEVRAIRMPNNKPAVFTATVWTLGSAGDTPRIELLDANSNVLDAQILANGNGRFTIQAAAVPSDKTYYVAVEAGAGGDGVGNYQLTVDFGSRPAVVTNFIAGTLTTAAPAQNENVYIARTQLFHFLLSAQGTTSGSGVRMTILDSAGNTVYTLSATVGDTVSSPGLLLKPGAYKVRYETIGTGPVTFSVKGSSDTDPIGPVANDPTSTPLYTSPSGGYIYPGDVTSTIPYFWALLTL